ncbi:MAG: hypothetical protein EOO48_01925 [Flavobacterium sp.]|nr:MAG: hypothetical protein EOO48_01925 [Flavobacterium sp.]
MESFKINVIVQGSEIAFTYRQDNISHLWLGVVVDECQTIEGHVHACSAEECLDELVPFLERLGDVVSVTETSKKSQAAENLRRRLKLAS